jgi:hypothetical protein
VIFILAERVCKNKAALFGFSRFRMDWMAFGVRAWVPSCMRGGRHDMIPKGLRDVVWINSRYPRLEPRLILFWIESYTKSFAIFFQMDRLVMCYFVLPNFVLE